MQVDDLSSSYTIADGPDELSKVLDQLLQKSQTSGELVHYILYRLGMQKSLIKVDFQKKPYQFWYCDTLGRPITNKVKDIIARFLWEKGGEREQYVQQTGVELHD